MKNLSTLVRRGGFCFLLSAFLLLATLAGAQSRPQIWVSTNMAAYKAVVALTNGVPSRVTTNLNRSIGLTRAWLLVQNTNATATVILYRGLTTNQPVAVLLPGQTWSLSFPTVDHADYSGTTANDAPASALVTEAWGQ